MQKPFKFSTLLAASSLALLSCGVLAEVKLDTPANTPKKVALLLPLQGKLADAGEAVSDGYFAAYYQALATTPALADTSILRVDTSKGAAAAYQQAVTAGAELIIGPLDKDDVNQIAKLTSAQSQNIPTLSLNYPDNQITRQNPNFFSFGLGVEDDAKQIARQAYELGHRRALIVAPAQDWSERSAQAFMLEWQTLGGTLVTRTAFGSQDKFAETLKSVLLVDESQARYNQLQQQLATKMEFSTRRRNDIDMIFIAATPTQGRQIKPTFAFYFANNIPVYATGQIYAGSDDATGNDDLNGITFTALPWQFDASSPEKLALASQTKTAAVYGRLHALGVDAFRLQQRLASIKSQPDTKISGATGELHADNWGRIERTQLLARFNKGIAEPVAIAATNDEDTPE